MTSLHRKIADLQELSEDEMLLVSGGDDGDHTRDMICSSDSNGNYKCIRGFDS